MGPSKTASLLTEELTRLIFNAILFLVIAMVTMKMYLHGLFAVPNILRFASADSFQDSCLSFKPQVEGATLEMSEFIPGGTTANLPYRDSTCGGPGVSPELTQDICRVGLFIRTSAQSGVQFEAWLPREWNGRFLATGNGGIGGCIDYGGLAYTTQHGFAAVGANNGHNGTTGKPFYHNPDVVADFAGRSLHTSVVSGKEVVKSFYGKSHMKSYFLGCSQGGRQGIGSAEKYPGDFDGIVAGAPALDFNHLISWRASFFPITGPADSPEFIKPSVWTGLIHDEVMKQCDELDGVKDGIIEYPDRCHFQPEVLECKGDAVVNCLSSAQLIQVRKIFSPLRHEDGTLIYPGMQPGSELRAIDRLYAGKPFSDSQDWYRYVVYEDPTWDPASFTTRDAYATENLNPNNIRTFPSHLDPFRSAGGKVIMYHGMQDQQITGFNTERWYEHILRGSKSTTSDLDNYVRYFRISGMNHCGQGPGAWMIGQGATPTPYEPSSNVLAAIVAWVEQGSPPETLEGTKFNGDSPSAGVAFKRKHCRYPRRNILKGKRAGSTVAPIASSADDWECV